MFQARRWKFKFGDEGEVSVGTKPLGLKAWSCGEKKMVAKLEETYAKREGEECKNGSTGKERQQWLQGKQAFGWVWRPGSVLEQILRWLNVHKEHVSPLAVSKLLYWWHVCGMSLNCSHACEPDSQWEFFWRRCIWVLAVVGAGQGQTWDQPFSSSKGNFTCHFCPCRASLGAILPAEHFWSSFPPETEAGARFLWKALHINILFS